MNVYTSKPKRKCLWNTGRKGSPISGGGKLTWFLYLKSRNIQWKRILSTSKPESPFVARSVNTGLTAGCPVLTPWPSSWTSYSFQTLNTSSIKPQWYVIHRRATTISELSSRKGPHRLQCAVCNNEIIPSPLKILNKSSSHRWKKVLRWKSSAR